MCKKLTISFDNDYIYSTSFIQSLQENEHVDSIWFKLATFTL